MSKQNLTFSSLETTVDRMILRGSASVPEGRPQLSSMKLASLIGDDVLAHEVITALVGPLLDAVSPTKWRSVLHRLFFFRALLVLYQDSFGDLALGQNVLQSMARTLVWPDDDVVKYIKFAVSAPLARFLKNELPPAPPGWAGGWRLSCGSLSKLESHLMINSTSRRSAWYFASYQDVKNGCCPMDGSDFLQAYEDHAQLLKLEAPVLDAQTLMKYQTRTFSCLHRGKHEKGSLVIPSVHDIEVSKRACLTQGVLRGGAAWQIELDTRLCVPGAPRGDRLFVERWFQGQRLDLTSQEQWLASDGEENIPIYSRDPVPLFDPFCDEESVLEAEAQHNESQGWAPLMEALHGTYLDQSEPDYPPDHVEPLQGCANQIEIWAPRSILVDRLLFYGLLHSRATVRATAIAESLKVRIVTLGDPYTGALAMHAQKDLWSRLREKKQFSLIGEPLETHHLDWMLAKYRELAIPGEILLVSGDYKGATDRLNMNLTKAVLETYLDGFVSGTDDRTEIFRDMCRKNLYEQTITYPPVSIGKKKYQVPDVYQRNGQLMGSQLSFPVLCVVNLITYWIAMEGFYGRLFQLHQLPVLVNGDDIAFPGTIDFIDHWKHTLDIPGFVLSVGKNFVHSKFLTMNSMLFHLRGNEFERIQKLNVGLLLKPTSVKRRFCNAGGETQKDVVAETIHVSPASIAEELVQGCTNQVYIMGRFLHYHDESLRFWSKDGLMNYFVDPALGGLGLPLVEGWKSRYTPWQRALALNLSRKHGLRIDNHTLPAFKMAGYVRIISSVPIEASRFQTVVPVDRELLGWTVGVRESQKTLSNSVPTTRVYGPARSPDMLPQWRKRFLPLPRNGNGEWEKATDNLMETRWKIATLSSSVAERHGFE